MKVKDFAEYKEAKRPSWDWYFLGFDTENFNVDMEIYQDPEGNLYCVDADWRWGF